MSDSNKRVFISYRRSVSQYAARAIFQDLKSHGYDAFMDVESINNGAFDNIILNQIASRSHFVLILTHGSLDRCIQPDDWLRREIEHAMETGRNIVPVLEDDFHFDAARQFLTGKLEQLDRHNGLKLYNEFFDAAMEKLRTRYLNKLATPLPVKPLKPHEEQWLERKREQTNSEPAPTDRERMAERQVKHAVKLLYQDRYDEAIIALTQALNSVPRYLDAAFLRGQIYTEQGKWASAVQDFTHVITLNRQHAEAHLWRGQAYEKLREYASAMHDYDFALRINPNYAQVYASRANLWRLHKKHDHALHDILHAIKLDAGNALFFVYRAAIYRDTARFKLAMSDANHALAMDPNLPDACNIQGLLYYDSGDFDEAQNFFMHAVALKPDYAEAYFNRANVLLKRNNTTAAMKDLNRVITHDPQHAEALCRRGTLYLAMGSKNKADAVRDFEAALVIQPNYEHARLGLERAKAIFSLRSTDQMIKQQLDDTHPYKRNDLNPKT